jgi:hypothetical protein
VWNYWLGGKDHFAADRAAADEAIDWIPQLPVIARSMLKFVNDTVRELAGRQGVRQFLDIGTGLPVDAAIHQVAQSAAPDVRVMYVDNDPIVTSHARALLVRGGTGTTDYAELDLRDTSEVLTRAAKTIDFSEPVAVLLSAVVHFVPDADDPWAIVARLADTLAPGSYLLITHAASDITPAAIAAMASSYNERAPVALTPRSREQVTRFFDGLTLTGPGVVPAGAGRNLPAYFGLGRKAR